MTEGARIRPRVAIVDADETALRHLEPALHAAGFETERVQLADYPDGRSAFATLEAQGVQVVLYELTERLEENQRRFQELYEASREHGRPLFITSVREWQEEEQEAFGAGARGIRPAAMTRLVRALEREIDVHFQDG